MAGSPCQRLWYGGGSCTVLQQARQRGSNRQPSVRARAAAGCAARARAAPTCEFRRASPGARSWRGGCCGGGPWRAGSRRTSSAWTGGWPAAGGAAVEAVARTAVAAPAGAAGTLRRGAVAGRVGCTGEGRPGGCTMRKRWAGRDRWRATHLAACLCENHDWRPHHTHGWGVGSQRRVHSLAAQHISTNAKALRCATMVTRLGGVGGEHQVHRLAAQRGINVLRLDLQLADQPLQRLVG